MAKKADLLKQAKELGLKLNEKNTIAEIELAISEAGNVSEVKEENVAKAGKRSKKSLEEVAEKLAKEERKESGDTSPQSEEAAKKVKKGAKPVTRPKIERRGKKYQAVYKLIDKSKSYDLTEGVATILKTNPAKFDASVELHVRLNVDPRQADQNIRSTVSLPNGSGKTIRVAVFAPEDNLAEAKKAGADIALDEDFLAKLDKEQIDFDTLITIPKYMSKLSKYARILGPRGLMPNPKSGTVTTDIAQAVSEAKAGKVEYRVDKQSIIHLSVGKVSFGEKKLEENITTFFDNLKSQRPNSIKGVFVKSISLTTTQGPSIKLENNIN